MAEVDLSEAERTYIVHGVQDDLRVDGRACDDYRYMEVETEVVSNTNGSARLRLANSDILVGIKVMRHSILWLPICECASGVNVQRSFWQRVTSAANFSEL